MLLGAYHKRDSTAFKNDAVIVGMLNGHLWDRLAEAKTRLEPVLSIVLFEDPANQMSQLRF